jgi:hypothetical protein
LATKTNTENKRTKHELNPNSITKHEKDENYSLGPLHCYQALKNLKIPLILGQCILDYTI